MNSMLGNYRQANETPFKWYFAGGPMMARLYWHLDPPSPHTLKEKKNVLEVEVGPPLIKRSGSAHGVAILVL